MWLWCLSKNKREKKSNVSWMEMYEKQHAQIEGMKRVGNIFQHVIDAN